MFTHLSFLFCLFFPLSVGLLPFFFLGILNPSSPVVAPSSLVSLLSPIYLSPAWILQAGRLLPDDAEAPGGKNWQGWAASVQPGISVWGAREKVLDHKLDRDEAFRLLRPLFWTPNQSHENRFDLGQKRNSECALTFITFQCNILKLDVSACWCFYHKKRSVVRKSSGAFKSKPSYNAEGLIFCFVRVFRSVFCSLFTMAFSFSSIITGKERWFSLWSLHFVVSELGFLRYSRPFWD